MADRPPLALDPGSNPPGRLGDPRVLAFQEWVKSMDRRDVEAMRASTRTLRTLGVSVVATGRGKP